jgi:hypothetical protein
MRRYGIGEWYGKNFLGLPDPERQRLAELSRSGLQKSQVCPFRSRPGTTKQCTKPGGVCSIRNYDETSGRAVAVAGSEGSLRVTE